MKTMKHITLSVFFCLILIQPVIAAPVLEAPQCAMCRAVLQSEEDDSTAKGVNNGIKYLMIIPYLLVGGVFYFIYKSRKASKNEGDHSQEPS